MKITFPLILLFPALVFAHDVQLDNQGGHFDSKDKTYHCHKEPCFSIHKQAEEAYQQAEPRSFTNVYNRNDWPHWIDDDGDCQNTRQEILIATSKEPVKFKDSRRCTVTQGQWYGVYTGEIYTNASAVDIDHVVPLAHAHRHGADSWTASQRRTFANDFDNLLVVDDATNQAKSDKAPHEWLPPQKDYWCEYGKRWEKIKDKYGLSYGGKEIVALSLLADTCG